MNEDICLPKWPEIRVLGKPITKEQAAIMAVRLSQTLFCSNVDETNRMIARRWYGFDPKGSARATCIAEQAFRHYGGQGRDYYGFQDRVADHYANVPTSYLDSQLIESSWIGGPHSWFRLDGTIQGTHAYNIGKWPIVSEVLEDWSWIVEAFPFLELDCQLFSGEECEDGCVPIVQFRLSNGLASIVPVGDPLPKCPSPDLSLFFGPGRTETAFTEDQLEEALRLTTESLGKPRWPDFTALTKL